MIVRFNSDEAYITIEADEGQKLQTREAFEDVDAEKACLHWVSQGRTLVEIALLAGKGVIEIELVSGGRSRRLELGR
jgi:hypothetical protein